MSDLTSGGLFDDYARLARQVRETQRKLDEAQATAHSDDGLISATVSGRGELLELTLNPRVYRNPDAGALGATIKEVVAEASEAARQQAFELNRPFLPRDADPVRTDATFDPFLHQLSRRVNGDRG